MELVQHSYERELLQAEDIERRVVVAMDALVSEYLESSSWMDGAKFLIGKIERKGRRTIHNWLRSVRLDVNDVQYLRAPRLTVSAIETGPICWEDIDRCPLNLVRFVAEQVGYNDAESALRDLADRELQFDGPSGAKIATAAAMRDRLEN